MTAAACINGHKLSEGARFCPQCGTPVPAVTEPPLSSAQQSAAAGYPAPGPSEQSLYPRYPYQAYPPPGRGTSGFAVASLVLGILWIWGLGAVFALIFGLIAKRQIRASEGRQSGDGMATAGTVLGAIGIVGAIAITVIVAVTATNANHSNPSEAGSSPPVSGPGSTGSGTGSPSESAGSDGTQTVTLQPATGLHDGEVIHVVGTGFTPGVTYNSMECKAGSYVAGDCNLAEFDSATADSSGTVSLDYIVREGPFGTNNVVCSAAQPCGIGVAGGNSQGATANLSFG